MSIESYDRAVSRETFWEPFVYSFPFSSDQTTDRNIIFGLYSGSYQNQHIYLNDVETSDLSNLLNDYNTKLAELSTQEQRVLADIVSRRYLSSIDKAIHDQKLVTKQHTIDAENLSWDAKMAALAADQAALATLDAKVVTEIAKTGARIAELESYIATEAYNLTHVDIEIAEREIQSAKVDIEKLNAQNAILKIQIDIVEAAIKLVNVDEEIARTKISIANINRELAKMGLYPKDLLIEQSYTTIAQAELPLAISKVNLAVAKGTELDAEIVYYGTTLVNQEAIDLLNKESKQDINQIIRLDELLKSKESKELDMYNREALSSLDVLFANADKIIQAYIDGQASGVISVKTATHSQALQAAYMAAEIMAKANIVTNLTHTIKKA